LGTPFLQSRTGSSFPAAFHSAAWHSAAAGPSAQRLDTLHAAPFARRSADNADMRFRRNLTQRLLVAFCLSLAGANAAACTTGSGFGRFALGLDPALTCEDVAAVRRLAAVDFRAIAQAGDVLVPGRFDPTAEGEGYLYLRPQPIRGFLVSAIATSVVTEAVRTDVRVTLGWDETLSFVRLPFERAGWRFTCARDGRGERCRGERTVGGPDGARLSAVLVLETLATPSANRVRTLSRCHLSGIGGSD